MKHGWMVETRISWLRQEWILKNPRREEQGCRRSWHGRVAVDVYCCAVSYLVVSVGISTEVILQKRRKVGRRGRRFKVIGTKGGFRGSWGSGCLPAPLHAKFQFVFGTAPASAAMTLCNQLHPTAHRSSSPPSTLCKHGDQCSIPLCFCLCSFSQAMKRPSPPCPPNARL
jgi:hypothetical protein